MLADLLSFSLSLKTIFGRRSLCPSTLIMKFEPEATRNQSWFKNVLQTIAFFGGYLVFAVLGSLASIVCAIPSLVFRGARSRRFGQELIHGLFRFFVGYLRLFGLVELDASALADLRNQGGMIVVANHPCLLDAVLVVSQLPRVVCLMKGSLARNIVLSGTSRLAGYIHNRSSFGLVKTCGQRLGEGSNLLIFPEGTRTVGPNPLPFKRGFALVAVLTRSPVQTVIVTANSPYLGKGWPFLKKPSFPLRYVLRPGKRFEPAPETDVEDFGGMIENYFLETLAGPSLA